jgi:hypothetical protein
MSPLRNLFQRSSSPADDEPESDMRIIRAGGEHVELPRRPNQLRIISTLEIVVDDGNGAFLLVVYPDYSGAESDFPTQSGKNARFAIAGVEPGEWTPPYRTYNVMRILERSGHKGPAMLSCDTAKLIELFDKAQAQSECEPLGDLYDTAEALGLRRTEITEVEVFHEFRPSYRHPNEYRGYRIIRHRGTIEQDDFENVADPEMRKGLAFLPIDDLYDDLPARDCPNHNRPERLFLGRPIANNLRTVLEDATQRSALANSAITVEEDRFYRVESGFIFAGDLAGYGRCTEFVSSEGGGYDQSGEEVATALRDAATHAFTRLFMRSGIYQTHTAGDGFLCALPQRELDAQPQRLKQFLENYAELIERLNEINAKIADLAAYRKVENYPQLGSRLAVHHGEYRFGKISLFGSLLPTFDGAPIIHAARLEGGLRTWLAEQQGQVDRHAIVTSAEAQAAGAAESLPDGWNCHGQGVSIEAKEFAGTGDVYCRGAVQSVATDA